LAQGGATEILDMPQVQAMIWKHRFGKTEQGLERYETMNVFCAAGKFNAPLFGTEHEQVCLIGNTMADCCAMLEHHFRKIFPEHVCGDGCNAS
jgi:hypothetical protein